MHHSYAGCESDYGWFVVVDTPTPTCDWEKHWTDSDSWPTFLYVKAENNTNYVNYDVIGQADSVAIFTTPAAQSLSGNTCTADTGNKCDVCNISVQ